MNEMYPLPASRPPSSVAAGDRSHVDAARSAAIRELALESPDPGDAELQRIVGFGARLLGVPFAFVNLLDDQWQFHHASTVADGPGMAGSRSPEAESLCRYVVLSGEPLLLGDLLAIPELREHPAVVRTGLRSYAGVPLRLADGQIVGTFCIADEIPHEWDERVVQLLDSMAADARGWIEVRRIRRVLGDEERRRQEAEEQARLARLNAEVGLTLTRGGDLSQIFQRCCEAVVEHLDAAFARIWTLNEAAQELELRASAGLYTHLDGPHSRVPVGALKIGLIASERSPHLTNDVCHDSRIGDPEWARRENLVFCGISSGSGGSRGRGGRAVLASRPQSRNAGRPVGRGPRSGARHRAAPR